MKKLRKSIALILAVATICLLLASCGKNRDDQSVIDLGSVEPGVQQTQQADQPANANETPSVWTPASVLSNDYHSGQLQIDGVVYDVPIKVSDFMSHGWRLINSWNFGQTLEADDSDRVSFTNGSTEIMTDINNYSSQTLPLENCFVMGISVSNSVGHQVGKVIMPGGLEFGKSTYYDIIGKWGTPSHDGVSMGSDDINYAPKDGYMYIFNFDSGKVINYVRIYDKNTPANVSSYNSYNNQATQPQTEVYYTEQQTAQSQDLINLSTLRQIESNDSFEVKITKKELIKNYYEGQLLNIGEKGNDACVFTIENNSGSDVKEVVFLAVGYDANNSLEKIGGTITFFGEDKYVIQFTTQNSNIKSGTAEKIGVRCDGGELEGVCAIVYSYTTSDGAVHTNSNAQNWFQNVHQSTKTFD